MLGSSCVDGGGALWSYRSLGRGNRSAFIDDLELSSVSYYAVRCLFESGVFVFCAPWPDNTCGCFQYGVTTILFVPFRRVGILNLVYVSL